MTEKPVLTVQDVLDELNSIVSKNPEALQYQIAEGVYDDYSCSCLMFYYGCKEVIVTKRPKDKGFSQGVDDAITAQHIVMFN